MQGKSKKNTKDTTQVDQIPAASDAETPFEKELLKKIRNLKKKLTQIEDLEKKVKDQNLTPNEDQRQKIADKPKVQTQIDEIKYYHDLFKSSQKEQANADKKLAAKHERQLHQSRLETLSSLTNVIALSSIQKAGGAVEDGVAEAIDHLSSSLHALANTSGDDYNWKNAISSFSKSWMKLVTGSKDSVEGSDLSYDEVNRRATQLMETGNFPAVLQTKKEEPVKHVQEAHEAQEEEAVDIPDDAADLAAGFDDAFGSDSDDAPPAKTEAPTQEPAAAVDEAVVAQEADDGKQDQEEEKAQDGERSGDFKRRGGRRGRGGADRGGADGEGKLFERGERGGYRGDKDRRRRPNTAYKKNTNEDDEGFNVVQDKSEQNRGRRRPRGRGNYRGGDRGDFRGGDRGGERSGRGDRGRGGRGRGERPPRKSAEGMNDDGPKQAPAQATDASQQ